jgi:hypothetical protein
MNESIRLLADTLAAAAQIPSETALRWESERYLMRNDPLLAKMLRAEAIAGHRAENHVSEASKLPMIRDLLRDAIAEHTGKPFKNPIFPE